jgi:hypothetical protein
MPLQTGSAGKLWKKHDNHYICKSLKLYTDLIPK